MSKNLAKTNTKKLLELFPEIVTEIKNDKGNIVKAINKDKLEQLINVSIVDNAAEQYGFNWAGKQNAIATANAPTNKKLIFCEEESISPDTTENLYIEGDNLDILKILQEDYEGKIKMIYIDPPYNTRHKFVYNDKFSHTDWLNMMYPRLRLAKNLLTEDGVIFISIDDNEVRNLKILCDEIFGEQNFVAQMIWKSKPQGGNDNKNVVSEHEYILIYCRRLDAVKIAGRKNTGEKYRQEDEYLTERGKYSLTKLDLSTLEYRVNLDYPIMCPDGSILFAGNVTKEEWEKRKSNTSDKRRDWRWRWEKKRFEEFGKKGFVEFKKNNGVWNVYTKEYEKVDSNGNFVERTIMYRTVIDRVTTINGTHDVKELFDDERVFTFPKPVDLVKQFSIMGMTKDSIILDFFSGSATTAHAVMQLNAEDGGKRKFIMVQLQEECPKDSEAFKAGYKNICEIGKERIRRAGKKIVDEAGLFNNLDIGFKVYKTIEKENEQTIN